MREMQAQAYESKNSQYLLVKAPPASGKSRALMFIALDKLKNQGLKKTIVCVPQKMIGSSFRTTDLKSNGFFLMITRARSRFRSEKLLQNIQQILTCQVGLPNHAYRSHGDNLVSGQQG